MEGLENYTFPNHSEYLRNKTEITRFPYVVSVYDFSFPTVYEQFYI